MSDLAAFIAFVVQDLVALSSDPLVGEVYECRVQDHLVNLAEDFRVSFGQAGQAVALCLAAGLDVSRFPLDVLRGGDTSDLGIEPRTSVAGVDLHRLPVDVPERLKDRQGKGLDCVADLEGGNHVDYPLSLRRVA